MKNTEHVKEKMLVIMFIKTNAPHLEETEPVQKVFDALKDIQDLIVPFGSEVFVETRIMRIVQKESMIAQRVEQ